MKNSKKILVILFALTFTQAQVLSGNAEIMAAQDSPEELQEEGEESSTDESEKTSDEEKEAEEDLRFVTRLKNRIYVTLIFAVVVSIGWKLFWPRMDTQSRPPPSPGPKPISKGVSELPKPTSHLAPKQILTQPTPTQRPQDLAPIQPPSVPKLPPLDLSPPAREEVVLSVVQKPVDAATPSAVVSPAVQGPNPEELTYTEPSEEERVKLVHKYKTEGVKLEDMRRFGPYLMPMSQPGIFTGKAVQTYYHFANTLSSFVEKLLQKKNAEAFRPKVTITPELPADASDTQKAVRRGDHNTYYFHYNTKSFMAQINVAYDKEENLISNMTIFLTQAKEKSWGKLKLGIQDDLYEIKISSDKIGVSKRVFHKNTGSTESSAYYYLPKSWGNFDPRPLGEKMETFHEILQHILNHFPFQNPDNFGSF